MSLEKRSIVGGINATVALVLLAVILVLANYIAARHYRRFDWTKTRIYALSDKTVQVLRGLQQDLRITVVEIPETAVSAADVYGAVREVLERFKAQNPRIKVEYLDPIREPERAKMLLQKYRITNFDVQTGVVIFDNGTQNKYVTQDEIVEYELGPMGRGRKMKAFKGEAAFLSAILTIQEKQRTLCFVKGHVEAETDSFERTGYSTLADELRRDAFATRTIENLAEKGIPAECDAVVVGGPQKAWLKPEADALETYLSKGGRAILLLGPVFDWKSRTFKNVGLEELVTKRGLKLGQNIVVDPKRLVPLGRLVWRTDRYGDHPVTARMTDAPTSWPLAREVRAPGAPDMIVKELVMTTEEGWGESDLASFDGDNEPKFDPARDAKGPVPVAAAAEDTVRRSRIVVFGSSAFVSNALLDLDTDFNRDLFLNAVGWVVGREQSTLGIAPKATEHVRLTMTEADLWKVGLLAVLLLPLGAALTGFSVWWFRRN